MRNAAKIVPQLPVFLGLIDPGCKLVYLNRVAFGYTRRGVLGKPADRAIVEEDRPAWQAAFRRALDFRETAPFSIRVNVPSPPGWAQLAGTLSPVVEGRKVVHVASVCHDASFRERPNPLARHMLTALGRSVVRFLLEHGPARGSAIGAHARMMTRGQASSRLRFVLNTLVERRILEHGVSGYLVTPQFAALAVAYSLIDP